jgi:hypothetical protein
VDGLYRSLDRYWEPERRMVEDGYARIQVPFPEVHGPEFEMHGSWTADDLIGYLGTWSALHKAEVAEGQNPLEDVAPRLVAAWGDASRRDAVWPLAVRAFRVD